VHILGNVAKSILVSYFDLDLVPPVPVGLGSSLTLERTIHRRVFSLFHFPCDILALIRSSWYVLRHVFFGRPLLRLPSSLSLKH